MRRPIFIIASIATMLSAPVWSQQSSQPVPDTPQPQPQKKPPAKSTAPATSPDPNAPAENAKPEAKDAKPAGKDENAFPEDVSKAAAAKAADPQQDTSAAPSTPGQHSTATDNPFPEAESKAAAKAAGNDAAPTAPERDVPSGISSSRSNSYDEVMSVPAKIQEDPGRAKKDAEVGGYYLKSGNFQGALLRFQDARTYDPTNVDAIFGLAETQRALKKSPEAAKNYQLYLDILPNGPKSKQALKALKEISSGG